MHVFEVFSSGLSENSSNIRSTDACWLLHITDHQKVGCSPAQMLSFMDPHYLLYSDTLCFFFSCFIFYTASLNMLVIADSEEVEWGPPSFLVALITE